ncbi:hypothetical protein F4821DRAFT_278948 [Hypoxylon rubiginosum]|uniref:Uncharacterized protein n=1 Tax=Hypoxylon rubiginosum TaxID=110542 RepID=A0ACC0D037_9PEZI|nr:hypothetical protein F4821DRAFT_278948 [Hypoxylon rubiginosum]
MAQVNYIAPVHSQAHDDATITLLTHIPGFDISQCRRVPRGTDLYAMKEIVLNGQTFNSPDAHLTGVGSLFVWAYIARRKYGYSGDLLWPLMWQIAPYHRQTYRYATHLTLKVAMEFYYDGLKNVLRSREGFAARSDTMNTPWVAYIWTAVARWAELVENIQYQVVVLPKSTLMAMAELDAVKEENRRLQALVEAAEDTTKK